MDSRKRKKWRRKERPGDGGCVGYSAGIPEGRFVYRPDSGFRGRAGRVRIYRQLQQRAVEKDTGAVRLTGISHQANAGSTLHKQVRQQLEETKKSKPVPLWVYALTMPVLLAMGFLCRKGFRRLYGCRTD